MATYRRQRVPGATWFFSFVTEGRRPLLVTPAAIQAMTFAHANTCARYRYALVAWAVLPDHVHALVRLPAGDSHYARRISIFKRLVSRQLVGTLDTSSRDSLRRRREAGVWQRRFWEHRIRDDRDLATHVDYIHYNAVKHGHALTAAAWPWSSFQRYVGRGMLPPDWAGDAQARQRGRFGE